MVHELAGIQHYLNYFGSIGRVLGNTGTDPLENHKATKPAFKIGPLWPTSKTPFKRCSLAGR